jgi:hypothetical protein
MNTLSFTQPICGECYASLNSGRVPIQTIEQVRTKEICAWCGHPTKEGIFTRVDPKTIAFPTKKKDEFI